VAKLIYSMLASLDGYIADESGNFDWAAPDDEVHAFVNDLERSIGTMLLGRRMYDVLVAWETMDTAGEPDAIKDYASLWRDVDKVVFSRTLDRPASARTRIEREFDADAIRRLKTAAARDLSIGGPQLASQAFKAGLVDECHLFLMPVIVGGGKRCLPSDARLQLELVDERRFESGAVHVHYRIAS
jgi:dihydrofolate reductase